MQLLFFNFDVAITKRKPFIFSGNFTVNNEVIRLKDLPSTIEYIIEDTANEDLRLHQ